MRSTTCAKTGKLGLLLASAMAALRRAILLAACSSLGWLPGFGQSPYRNVRVAGPNDSGFPNEPTIVVNPNNTLHLLAGSNLRYSYLAVSRDSGETFANTRISESPFTPFAGASFGDYTNISAHGGVVRPIWARLDNTTPSLWTAMINPLPKITDLAVTNGVVRLAIETSASYMIHVERSFNLQTGSWIQVDTFPAETGITHWSEPLGNGWSKAFYRLNSN
jgi:hypothetical protein